jgi:radical SAM protein with 4Fe4S-binding SPASM domain
MPTWFQFEVTNRCNFNCAICPRNQLKIEYKDLPFRRYKRLLGKLPTTGLVSLLGLGEPLLHKQLFDMVRLAKARGNEVSITTNGSLLDAHKSQAVLDSGLDYLRVSVDSVEQADNPSAHLVVDRVIDNAHTMVELRGDAEKPHLMFNTVVYSDTYQGIPDVIHTAHQIGFDAVNLIRLARNTATMHRLPKATEEKLFPEWHQYGEKLGIEVKSTYTQRNETFCYCPLWINYIYINLYGDVTPCCHLPERTSAVGNLLKQSLQQIWQGDSMQKFWDTQFAKVCAGCNLMTWHSPEEYHLCHYQET